MSDTARKILFKSSADEITHRAWDIGFSDRCTVTWFRGDEILHVDRFRGLSLREIKLRLSGLFHPVGNDYVRPDALCRSMTDGKTLVDEMREIGLRPVVVHPTAQVAA